MNFFLQRTSCLIILLLMINQSTNAQVTLYQQNFDGNNGSFTNTLVSQVTPINGWLASSTAAQYSNYRHVWNFSTLGTGNVSAISGRSLGMGFYNANSPYTANKPFMTWNGTSCGLIPATYRWAYVPISTLGFENIQVEFKWRCSGEVDAGIAYDYGTVNTSIDGGSTWLLDENGGVGGPTSLNGTYAGGLYHSNAGVKTQIINLPTSRNNKANFALAFRMVLDECYGTGGGFIVDDIIVRGTPIGGCAGGTVAPAYQFVQTNNTASVTVSGHSGANIQWQVSPNGSTGWTNVTGGSGANTVTYTSASLTNGNYYYRAVISDVSCSENSTTAHVLVAAEPVYCSGAGSGNAYNNNHIQAVGFHEWADPNPGYLSSNYLNYSDTTSYGYATVVAGQYHHFNAAIRANGTGTASTTVAAWVDFNGDGVFNNTPFASGGELLDIVNFSSTVGNTYAAYFTVPPGISGLKRIRIRALRGNFATIDPCGIYTNSQTKDFTIKVLPSIGTQVCGTVNGNADNVLTNSTTDKVNISRVLVEGPSGTVLDNNGLFFGVQAGSTITMYNYSNMMGAFSNGLILEAGQNYTVSVEHSGYTCVAGLFIDYNGDGDFNDANELVGRYSDPNANPFVFNFTVPASVTDGRQVAMRVRLRYDANANLGNVINACNNISDGLAMYSEVEDYRATLIAPSLVCAPVSNLIAAIGTPPNGLNHHLDVSWTALSGATNYDVEVSTDGIAYGSLQNVTSSTFNFNAGDQPNKPYWFRVRARDASQTCAWTPIALPTYTACDLPAVPSVTNATTNTLDVTLVPESPVANPSITTYSILCPTTGDYIQADGSLGATEVFQTLTAWATITVTGLNSETEYCFVAKARNQDGDLRGGQNSVSGLQTFTSNVLNTTGGSGPTNVWWSPSSCSTGGMVYFASGGCADGSVGFTGSYNNYYGCFLRSPAQNCTGLNSVIMTLDMSNSYFASQPGDNVHFNMWAPTASYPGGTYIAATKVNGVSTDQINFSQLRNCASVEVEFNLSSVTNKSAILFYLNATCMYNNSNLFSVRFDNISILEGAPGTCLSTTAPCPPPTIAFSVDDICPDASQFALDYTITQNSPITYSVSAATPALAGFTPITNQALAAAPNTLAIPLPASSTPGAYGFTLTVSSAGCSSSAIPFTLNVLNQTIGEWLGYTSAWETPSNWACNTLPSITTDVLIPTVPIGGAFPEINSIGIALSRNITISSAAKLTLLPSANYEVHGNFQNNGSQSLGTGSIYLKGSTLQTIGGTTVSAFNNLILQSQLSNEAIKLVNDISLVGTLTMNQGKFNLDNFSVFMGTTGVVQNESNDRRIYGASGELKSERVFAANSTYNNIAGMGISISTGAISPGPTTIERGHLSQEAGMQNNSIQRYFDISPSVNADLDATLKINYFDDELVDIDGINPNESDLITWRSQDNGTSWEGQFFPTQISRDVAANWVQQTGIPAFSRWTLSDWLTEPLPITLIDFQANENNGTVLVNWTTASEINNDYFTVERSADASKFSEVFRRSGAGNSSTILNYVGVDERPLKGVSYYRLMQTDFDGTTSTSNIVAVNIKAEESDLGIHRINSSLVNLTWHLSDQESFSIDLFDTKGKLLHTDKQSFPKGLSNSVVNHGDLPPGIYILRAVGSNGNVFVKKIHLN